MRKTTIKRRHFTLPEVMIASALVMIVVAGMLSVMLFGLRLWRNAVTESYFEQQFRLVRERINRGLEGGVGLRECEASSVSVVSGPTGSIHWVDFYVDTNTPPTPRTRNDDVACRLETSTAAPHELAAEVVPGSGTAELLIRPGFETTHMDITRLGNVVTIDVTLRLTSGGRVFTRTRRMTTYVAND